MAQHLGKPPSQGSALSDDVGILHNFQEEILKDIFCILPPGCALDQEAQEFLMCLFERRIQDLAEIGFLPWYQNVVPPFLRTPVILEISSASLGAKCSP